ncbi:sulfatase [Stella sp.]|uniref:sulfatase family protein n=1 Tax=Stella sp. TaxID=2912054 RepID=UPI0035B4D911
MADRPNIVLVMTDQQRADTLGCLGSTYVETPNLDRLAARGVVFPQAFTPMPICSPARASLWTGLYPHRHRVEDNVYGTPDGLADSDGPTVFPDLRAAGYRSAYIGKWHLGKRGPPALDRWLGYNSGRPHWIEQAGGARLYRPVVETDQAIAILSGHDRSHPLFLVVSYYPPHPPFDPPEPYRAAHAAAPRPGYYGAVRAIDDCVGRLVDAIDRLGFAADTAILFCSDHGQRLRKGEDSVMKRSLRDESIRIPLIVVPPGGRRAGAMRCERLVGLMDVVPTLRALAGLPAPAGPGPSANLLPLARGSAPPWRDAMLFQNRSRADRDADSIARVERAVRTSDAKLIWRLGGRPALYDLRIDPDEHHDLMRRPIPPRGPLRRLAEVMRDLGEEAGDAVAVRAADEIVAASEGTIGAAISR